MDLWTAFFLGIIQGLTEFLPVSSSGHLVIFGHLFGMKEPALLFDVSVHVGTLFAVILFFKKDIADILSGVYRAIVNKIRSRTGFHEFFHDESVWFCILIIAGSVPTAIIGLFIKKAADEIYASLTITGSMLLITGLLLWILRRIPEGGKEISNCSISRGFMIGISQGLSVLPGLSRSGSTIATGLFLGLDRETAARYSFLLSIPAIIGAEFLSLKDASGGVDMPIILGTISAGMVGFFALKFLVYLVNQGRLFLFSPYCWAVGSAALIWGITGKGGL